jgi:hypothetical protein
MLTRDDKHRYFWFGKRVPGASEILSGLGMIDYGGVPGVSLEKARDFGTEVHWVCELHDKGKLGKYDEAIAGHLHGWKNFIEDFQVVHTAIEVMYFCQKWHFAMQLDRSSTLVKGGRKWSGVVDIKATVGIKPAVEIQTALYKIGEEERTGQKLDGRVVVRLDPKKVRGYELYWQENKIDESIAISAVNVFRWKYSKGLVQDLEANREIFGSEGK